MIKEYKNILNKIKEYKKIIIHRHARPDGDAIGSQIGLKEAIIRSFPKKTVYAVGDEGKRFNFIGKMDEIKDEEYEDALVFVLDTGSQELISDERYKTGKYLIKIDHHICKDPYGNISIADTSFVSCASIIADMVFELKLKLSTKGAQALFTGMVTDSGRFRYDGVDQRTFNLAGRLISYGFSEQFIYKNLYTTSLEKVKLRAKLTNEFKISEGGVAYLMNTTEDIKKYNTDFFSISRGMVGVMGGIEGIDIWANFTQDGDKVIAELRSSEYNINPVAVKYGGGGHAKACGATLDSFDVAYEMIKDLEKFLEE